MRRQESSWLTNESSGHSELEGNGHPWLSCDHYNQVQQQKIGPSIVLAMSGARNLFCVVIIHFMSVCELLRKKGLHKLQISTRFLCAPVHRQRLTLNTGQVGSSRSQDFSPFSSSAFVEQRTYHPRLNWREKRALFRNNEDEAGS